MAHPKRSLHPALREASLIVSFTMAPRIPAARADTHLFN
ncbi:hypothetical protein L842_6154 [Mycobacterium intracellulare MIN_052511_1280]|nr:hypothetical protein L842_6154 [Mycobacterium intracellulare MIN_052511_1280]